MGRPGQMMKLSGRAFTLTELLLAAAILAFVIAGLLMLFINCAFLNDANRNLTIATAHAQFAMEEIKNTTFASIDSTYNNVDWYSAELQSKELVPLNTEKVHFDVTGTDSLDVKVTLTWKDRGVRDSCLSFETLITEP